MVLSIFVKHRAETLKFILSYYIYIYIDIYIYLIPYDKINYWTVKCVVSWDIFTSHVVTQETSTLLVLNFAFFAIVKNSRN